jgi:hypothetical protein
MGVLVLFLLVASSSACSCVSFQYYVSHTFSFPTIPYSAGVYHIHSPVNIMQAHGLALPGFRLVETLPPRVLGDYVTSEFFFRTHFRGRMSGRMFSSHLNTSHVVLMDPDGIPCLLGKLTLHRCAANGHRISARADLLRPANVWERLFGGEKLVKESEVARMIKLGYSSKTDANILEYVRMVFECDKMKRDPA